MAKKKSSNSNSNNNNNNKEINKNEELIYSDDDDSGEWTNVPTKEEKNKEKNEKREKKKQELLKKREQEIKEHNEKQKKIAELFSDSSKAFSTKNRPTNYNPWDILDDDASDNENEYEQHIHSHKKQVSQKQENPNNGFSFNPGKLSEIQEKARLEKLKQKQKKQKQQQKLQQQQQQLNEKLTFNEAIKSFDYEKYYELLKNVEVKFPSVVDIQIQYISQFLEDHFGKVQSDQSVFYQRLDYLSKFDEKFKKETISFLERKPIGNIIPTVLFLINNVISILRKDHSNVNGGGSGVGKGNSIVVLTSGVGYEILLQVMLRYFPDTLLKNLNHFKSINLPSLKTNVVSLYLWFFYQPISTNPSTCTSIWLQTIFTSLYKSKITNDSNLELFEKFSQLLLESKKIQKHGLKIDVTILDNTLDDFINSLVLQNVQSVALKYSDILFDIEKLFPTNKISSAYFLTLLNYSVVSDENLRNMILNKLIDCLNIDKDCYGYIKSKYVESIAQVNNLLLYILLQWRALDKSGIQLINLTKSNVYELALYSKEENNNLISKYYQNNNNTLSPPPLKNQINAKKKQLQHQQQLQQQKLKSTYDIDEVNLCNVTCDAVIQSFKPNNILRNISIILIPILIAVAAVGSRDSICKNYNNQYLQQLKYC